MNNVSIGRKTPLIERPVFIDGISRAGKFFLGKIVSGFDNIEYYQYIPLLEHLPFLERLGSISTDAAIALLQINVDEHAYSMHIGRNLNFRFDDLSSINNSLEADRYIKRSLNDISTNIIEEIKKDDRRALFVLHETLPNIGILFKTFLDMKWINLIRHPVDIIHSWYLRGWGHRFGVDALAFVPAVTGKNCPIPWFANEWKEEYETMSEADRIIRSVATLVKIGEETYLSLTEGQKTRIHTTSYENIISNTEEELIKMGTFLNMPLSQRMPIILARERCPRSLDSKLRVNKINDIKRLASKERFDLMMHLAAQYERNDFWAR